MEIEIDGTVPGIAELAIIELYITTLGEVL